MAINVATLGAEQIPELVAAVSPQVVHIDAHSADRHWRGSGFLIEPLEGDIAAPVIVTNAHVAGGATELWVRFPNGREEPASVRVCDPPTDLALLTIAGSASGTLALRRTEAVRVGEIVIAIGSPYGLEGTVTAGIVSGLRRTMPAPNRVPIENMVQTDAMINPGNSGGPLIGLDGKVIGVNDQTMLGEDHLGRGLGFAIPADTVLAIYTEICETGNDHIVRASLRARTVLRTFTREERKLHGQEAGALLVADPVADSPAAAAGLRRGDIIVAFNGARVKEPGVLYAALNRTVVNVACPLEYVRGDTWCETTVTPIRRVP